MIQEKKVWYVAIIGRPNAGKSTFVNALLDEKVSITSNVPQTTRKRVLAIHNDEDSQVIFFDTPGIHFEDKMFNKEINNQAISSLRDAQVVLYFIDSSRKPWEEEKYIRGILENVQTKIITVYTKIDLPSRINIPNREDVFSISSVQNKTGFDELLNAVKNSLKTWPLFFPEDFYTQQDMYFRVSEIIREKVFLNTKEELPHSIYVSVEEIEEEIYTDKKTGKEEEMLKIVAYINAESDSQKYILIGSKGSLIAKMWKEARIELEKVFEKKVFLALRVKVQKNWRKNGQIVKGVLN